MKRYVADYYASHEHQNSHSECKCAYCVVGHHDGYATHGGDHRIQHSQLYTPSGIPSVPPTTAKIHLRPSSAPKARQWVEQDRYYDALREAHAERKQKIQDARHEHLERMANQDPSIQYAKGTLDSKIVKPSNDYEWIHCQTAYKGRPVWHTYQTPKPIKKVEVQNKPPFHAYGHSNDHQYTFNAWAPPGEVHPYTALRRVAALSYDDKRRAYDRRTTASDPMTLTTVSKPSSLRSSSRTNDFNEMHDIHNKRGYNAQKPTGHNCESYEHQKHEDYYHSRYPERGLHCHSNSPGYKEDLEYTQDEFYSSESQAQRSDCAQYYHSHSTTRDQDGISAYLSSHHPPQYSTQGHCCVERRSDFKKKSSIDPTTMPVAGLSTARLSEIYSTR